MEEGIGVEGLCGSSKAAMENVLKNKYYFDAEKTCLVKSILL